MKNQNPSIESALRAKWISGLSSTPVGDIPVVSTRLTFRDFIGGWRVRWSIGRERYSIQPGLYGVGWPTPTSPVLVTANYKLSFDRLRKELSGMDAWILVLDTKGINVWCAAGKGTFGTEELANRIATVRLKEIVEHRTLILPQLGAPGVASHRIASQSGFRVVYGPIRAADIPDFIKSNLQATTRMRTITFTWKERLVLIPVELVQTGKLALPLFSLIALFYLISGQGISLKLLADLLPFATAILTGCVGVPLLLPWIPGRSLAWKGWLLGIIATLVFNHLLAIPFSVGLINLSFGPAIAAFLSLNFTGATTYTSLSGVKKEIRYSLPLILFSILLGTVLTGLRIFSL